MSTAAARGRIEIRLREIRQLFNSMDPSPFHEKDLDANAEEFLVSWATEHGRHVPLEIVVHLSEAPVDADAQQIVEQALHNYFLYREAMTRRELRQLLRYGRYALAIAVVFLAICVVASDRLTRLDAGALVEAIGQSLLIGGWVAMWRPLEIFLFDWWPLRAKALVLRNLATSTVSVVTR